MTTELKFNIEGLDDQQLNQLKQPFQGYPDVLHLIDRELRRRAPQNLAYFRTQLGSTFRKMWLIYADDKLIPIIEAVADYLFGEQPSPTIEWPEISPRDKWLNDIGTHTI